MSAPNPPSVLRNSIGGVGWPNAMSAVNKAKAVFEKEKEGT
jgi:hypothetical protein